MWRPYHRSAAANPPQTPERQQHVLCNRSLMLGSPAGMESLFVPDLASLHHAARVMGRKSRPSVIPAAAVQTSMRALTPVG